MQGTVKGPQRTSVQQGGVACKANLGSSQDVSLMQQKHCMQGTVQELTATEPSGNQAMGRSEASQCSSSGRGGQGTHVRPCGSSSSTLSSTFPRSCRLCTPQIWRNLAAATVICQAAAGLRSLATANMICPAAADLRSLAAAFMVCQAAAVMRSLATTVMSCP